MHLWRFSISSVADASVLRRLKSNEEDVVAKWHRWPFSISRTEPRRRALPESWSLSPENTRWIAAVVGLGATARSYWKTNLKQQTTEGIKTVESSLYNPTGSGTKTRLTISECPLAVENRKGVLKRAKVRIVDTFAPFCRFNGFVAKCPRSWGSRNESVQMMLSGAESRVQNEVLV